MTADTLSSRGRDAAESVMRIDLELFAESLDNLYHADSNPDGIFALNIAENNLGWHEISSRLTEISAHCPLPDWIGDYTTPSGHAGFRASLARFISRHIDPVPIDRENLIVTSGATAVVELSAWCLAEAGEVAMIPAPAYPVYRPDLYNKARVLRQDINCQSPSDGLLSLDIATLEQTRDDIIVSGRQPRMLILTQPDNPTGGIYTAIQLEAIADWCISHRIHLLVNELYALSQIDTDDPELSTDYAEQATFTSFLGLMHRKHSDYLHYWYSLSKDLGISGFRMGCLYSLNADFIQAARIVNVPHQVSNHSQWLMQQLLDDEAFMSRWIRNYQQSLTQAYKTVIRCLRELEIPYCPSRGSLFIWLDLSEFLTGSGEKAELELWRELFHQAGILLTPGPGFGHQLSGQYRMVFSGISLDELQVMCDRLSLFIRHKRRSLSGP